MRPSPAYRYVDMPSQSESNADMRTFKVIGPFHGDGQIELCCPKCGTDAAVPTFGSAGAMIIASCGLGLVLDPPGTQVRPGFLPDTIQCRKCKTIWTSEDEDVREAV